MKYLICANHADAADISRAAWNIICPIEGRNPGDVTEFRWAIIDHPTSGQSAVVVDGDENLLSTEQQATLVDALTADWSPAP